MFTEKFLEVLSNEVVVSIVTCANNEAHVSNTWNSYLVIVEENKYPPAKLVVFHKPYKGKLLACVLRRINGPAAAFYFTCYP